MPGLLDLPNELLLKIFLYLEPNQRTITLPFYQWAEWHQATLKQGDLGHKKSLLALLLSCRSFYPIISPIFYRDILVRDRPGRPLERFQWVLEEGPSFVAYVHSATFPCGDFICDINGIFWLENIDTLTICGFRDWEPLEFEDNSGVKESSVKHLRLINCGAHEEALKALLSWPASLETLHCDVGQGNWSGYYEGEEPGEWTSDAFMRALEPVCTTLKELILTRPPLVHEGLWMGSRVNLSRFTALSTLRIFENFLCGWDDPLDVWRTLPSGLEVLEVYYDDTGYTDFLQGYDSEDFTDWRGGNWLRELIRRKVDHFPQLSRVTIYSSETLYEGDHDLPAGPWDLPAALSRQCNNAGVEVSVFLGYVEMPEYKENVKLECI